MILEARHLSVSIGLHKVCLGLDLDLAPGSRLAILGRNGAGKSTLLSTLAGLRAADAGMLRLDGKSYAEHGLRNAARLRGWLGQARSDPFASTVLETVLTGRHPHVGRWSWESGADADIAREALETMGLAGMAEREVHTLSGGERQRVAIAALLAQAPRLYLLDEPLAHLDLNHQIATLELLSRRAREQGVAIVMVLHDPNFALRHCDQALLLFGDSRHVAGPAAEVIDAPTLSSLYGYPMRRVAMTDFPHAVFVPE
ncbi:MAG: ABC transporter ATP-binding protein [Rhodocyclaceae bacterium]|nr:ABC transporter ATP-binding protein [Rhodocyclaceae bacterium]MBK6677538.1 ABC transporter ATP-binding protein [Rhodocyclaceae bacterium]MBK9310196.1 ABC transporter ATP-binding protein [Rhodocyclaceae bacterium]MBK9954731.1 ABC transporter ATP-binding protein [Rhodocyclaceae bacterium]